MIPLLCQLSYATWPLILAADPSKSNQPACLPGASRRSFRNAGSNRL